MKYYLLILLFSFSLFSFSQEQKIIRELKIAIKKADKTERLILMDSLSNYIVFETKLKSDSILKATILYAKELDSIGMMVRKTSLLLNYLNYKKGDLKEAKMLVKKTKKLFPFLNNRKVLSKFYFEAADVYYYSGDYEKALQYFDSSYVYGVKYNDNFKGLAKLGAGIVYTDKGDFGNASITLKQAANIFREKKDSLRWLDVKNSIAILYGKNGFNDESKKERDELIAIASKMKSYNNLPATYYNNAGTSNKLGLQKERIKNYRLSILVNETSTNKEFFDPILKLALAAAYAENDSVGLSNKLIKEIEANNDFNKNAFLKTFYLEATMRIAFEKKQYQKAIALGEEYLAINYKNKNYDEIQKTEKFLYKIYKILGFKDKALKSYENYSKIKDSVSNIQKISALAYYQTLYETEKRDLTIKTQEDDILLLT